MTHNIPNGIIKTKTMKTTNNTVLITGGSTGMGYEMAKLMLAKGNRVIITGRDEKKLHEAASSLEGVIPIRSDVTNEGDVQALVKRIEKEFPDMNILINNAGRGTIYSILDKNAKAYENAKEEMETNYFSVIRLIHSLIPHLREQSSPAIVNVSSVVAIVPGPLASYSASKAALHSFTQALRVILEKETGIKVFELMPPLTNTAFSKGIGGANGMNPAAVAQELLKGIENDQYEIHPGQTAEIYKLFLSSPSDALKKVFSDRKVSR